MDIVGSWKWSKTNNYKQIHVDVDNKYYHDPTHHLAPPFIHSAKICQNLLKDLSKKLSHFPTKMCDTQWNVGLDNV